MELVADSSGSASDLRFRGFVIIMAAGAIFIIGSVYLMVAPPEFLAHARAAVFLAAGGALIVLATLGLALKGKGMLFKVPLKFFDEAVLIQPVLGLRPVIVPYKEIASMELWHGLGYKRVGSGCSVLSSRYSVTSVEPFKDKESLRALAEKVRPALESSGLKLKTAEDDAGSLHYVFQRDVGRRARAAEGTNPWKAL